MRRERFLSRSALNPLFNLRQACDDCVANDLQTLRRDLVERIFLRMPVGTSRPVRAELNQIDRVDAGFQERAVIVVADSFSVVDELRTITNLFSSLPDDVLQPLSAEIRTTQTQILITNHVEQNHRFHATEFALLHELRNVMAAAVCVVGQWRLRIGWIWIVTILPLLTERLFTIEENKSIGELKRQFLHGQDASNLHRHGSG